MLYKFILTYFFIGFISDLLLNYLSRQTYAPPSIKALRVYFQRTAIKNVVVRDFISATNAGLTVVGAILVTVFISLKVFKFYQPHSLSQLFQFLLLAFPVGYVMDILIYKFAVFGPTLNPFYKIAGAGFWGGMSIVFSILVCYAIFQLF